MVLRVCRDVLGDPHAAQDAYQAAFLVLARKARSIGRPEFLGNWLYGVARRVAMRAKSEAARRRAHESRAAQAKDAGTFEQADRDLVGLLHEEIARLPEAYRAAVVLCYLEGMTYEAAARSLRVTEGTIRGRLARARERLRTRLCARGDDLAPVLLPALGNPGGVWTAAGSPGIGRTSRLCRRKGRDVLRRVVATNGLNSDGRSAQGHAVHQVTGSMLRDAAARVPGAWGQRRRPAGFGAGRPLRPDRGATSRFGRHRSAPETRGVPGEQVLVDESLQGQSGAGSSVRRPC